MATFPSWGQTGALPVTPHSTYHISTGNGISIPDGVYRPGDIVPVSTAAHTTRRMLFLGREAGTDNLIFDIPNVDQFVILYASTPSPNSGNRYDPGGEDDILRETVAVGDPVSFADFGVRPAGGGDVLASQGKEIEIDQGAREPGATGVTLRVYGTSGGQRVLEETFQATFDGVDPATGDPVFTATSGAYDGRQVVAASTKDAGGYDVPAGDVAAEAWPPRVTFRGYGFRRGGEGDFDLQNPAGGFVGLDVPAGVHRPGDTLEIRLRGGVGGGRSVEVEFLGFYNQNNFEYPVFEAAEFDGGGRAQFIGTAERDGVATYAPTGNPNTFTAFGTGVARFPDYGLRVPQADAGTSSTNNLNSQNREIEFDYDGDNDVGDSFELRIYRISGGERVLQETVRAELAGFDRETGDPIFNPLNNWRDSRQIIAASVKETTYVVPHGDDVDDGDGTVEDRTGGDIVAKPWPRQFEATHANHGIRRANADGEFAGDFDLQGSGFGFGLHVPPGIYRAGDEAVIRILRDKPDPSEAPGAEIDVTATATFVGYSTSAGGDEYPIFQVANYLGGGPAQFIGTGEAHETDTYALPGGIVTGEPLGIGDFSFASWALDVDTLDGEDDFAIQEGGPVTFARGVYQPAEPGNTGGPVTWRVGDGPERQGTFVGYESATGFPVIEFVSGGGGARRVILLESTDLSRDSADYEAGEIVLEAWPAAGAGAAAYSNYGFRLGDSGDFDLRGAGIDLGDGVHAKGDTVDVRFHGGGLAGVTEQMTYIGHVLDGGASYPVFESADFRGNGKAQVIGTARPAAEDSYAVGPADLLATDVPHLEIGGTTVRFDAVALHQGEFAEPPAPGPGEPDPPLPYSYGVLGNEQEGGVAHVDIRAGAYARGGDQDDMNDPNTIVVRFDGEDFRAAFHGYLADTGFPVFSAIRTPPGQSRHFILLDHPPAGQPRLQNIPVARGDIVEDAYTTCFAPGTLIATPMGERAVEDLGPGDMVLTASGEAARVRWIGYQKVPTMFGPRELTHPVRIGAGALGENAPHTDLVVTKDHGMIVDGVICNAGALVNGTSIVEVPTAELGPVATYYHVETESHAQLLANGAPAESFVDSADRARFSNHLEFAAMFGPNVPAMKEMDLPRAMSARQVPGRIRARLAARAAGLAGAARAA